MVKYDPWSLIVGDLPGKWERGEIIPDPEWQRGYIWKPKDEQLLVDSILRGMPIPKFYVTQEWDSEKETVVYNVIDGQQRLTALYKFLTNKFTISIGGKEYYFKDLDKPKKEKITKYTVDGHFITEYSLPDITFLFERLNRTGIKLSNMENWNSKYTDTNILRMVKNIADEHRKYYDVIYTEENMVRLLHLDDIVDICNAISKGAVTSGNKNELENFLDTMKSIPDSDANRIKRHFRKAITIMKEVFPKEELQSTGFGKRTHYISLFMAVLLTGREYYLIGQVEKLRQQLIEFMNNQPKDYKDSVTGGIRHKERRVKRVDLLAQVLKENSVPLDKKRSFDPSTRMRLWNAPGGHECQICHKPIHDFKQATVDHVVPWAKGGQTDESNAQIAHLICNQKKRDSYEKFIVD